MVLGLKTPKYFNLDDEINLELLQFILVKKFGSGTTDQRRTGLTSLRVASVVLFKFLKEKEVC